MFEFITDALNIYLEQKYNLKFILALSEIFLIEKAPYSAT